MCYKMVRCTTCDLLFVDEPPNVQELSDNYQDAFYDSSDEAFDAAMVYAGAIRPLLTKLTNRNSALEIGAGTGVFLDHLNTIGFSQLVGVEPSTAAISAAPVHRKPWILQGMFKETDFQANSFDLVCCFMTLEHVREPGELIKSVSRLLKPGGAFVAVTHDYRSFTNRLLGKKSPIVDIEHMQLFSMKSLVELFSRANFNDIYISTFLNKYSLSYWIRISPVPHFVKRVFAHKYFYWLKNIKLSINVGNCICWGFKADSKSTL